MVANSKSSEKQHGCPWQGPAQGCCDPGLRQAAQDYVIQQEVGWTWHRQPGLKYQLAVTNCGTQQNQGHVNLPFLKQILS